MSNIILTHYQDPSHGWLKVSLTDPILKKITVSRCSYTDGVHVFLEEDRDMSLYLQACSEAGVDVEIIDAYTDNDSPIRRLKTYVDPDYVQNYRLLCVEAKP